MNTTLVHNENHMEVFKPLFAHGSAHDDTVAIVLAVNNLMLYIL